jgi:hypothetical protein
LKALGGWLPAARRGVYNFEHFCLKLIGTRQQSGAKNFAHLKLIKLSTYKLFATKLIGITRLV